MTARAICFLTRRACLRRVVERLEGRLLLSANSWKSAVNGDWDDASKWSAGHVPTASEDVTINLAGSYSVTHSTAAADSVHSVTSTRPLTLSLGSLNVTATMTMTGGLAVSGGKLLHATVSGSPVTFTTPNSALDGVTLNANATLADGATLTVTHGLTLQNAHVLTLTGNSADTVLTFDCTAGPQTLGGSGAIAYAGNIPQIISINIVNSAGPLTVGAGITIHGRAGHIKGRVGGQPFIVNQGMIAADTKDPSGGGIIIDGQSALTNQGTMSASGGGLLTIDPQINNAAGHTISATTGGTVTLLGTNWTNAGKISEVSATINLGGSFKNAGTVAQTGGAINLTGVVDEAGGAFTLSAATGSLNFKGGTIKNATISFAGGATLIPVPANIQGNILDKCVLNADLSIPNGTNLDIRNGLTILNNHFITLNGTTKETDLRLLNNSGTQAIAGSGQIVFGGTSAAFNVINLDPGTAVIASGIVVHGKGGTITTLTATTATLNNQGLIEADTPAQTITIAGKGALINGGNLMAAPGTIAVTIANFIPTTGALTFGIGGAAPGTSYGVISFSGPVTLGGTVNTIVINNFVPAGGATFVPLKYASKSGAFAVSNFNAGNGISFVPTFGAASLSLKAAAGGKSVGFRGGHTLTVIGTNLSDTITLKSSFGVVTVAMNGATSVFAAALVAAASITGNDGNDTIINSTAIPSAITGDAGDDRLVGGSGNDTLEGGAGNDTCIGNGGDDVYVFRGAATTETDFVSETAGGGTDTLDFSAVSSAIVGNLSSDTLATMLNRTVKALFVGQSANFENLFGGAGNDKLTGNAAPNLLKGNNGNDTFFAAGGGKDTLDGGLGTDIIGSADPTDVKISIP